MIVEANINEVDHSLIKFWKWTCLLFLSQTYLIFLKKYWVMVGWH
jgi:hypothetical protein